MEKNALFILSIGLLLVVLSGLKFDIHPIESWFGIFCLVIGALLFFKTLKKGKRPAKEDNK